jgi:hypothetical protein
MMWHRGREYDDNISESDKLNLIMLGIEQLLEKGMTEMATIQQISDALAAIKQKSIDYIASRDAIDAKLRTDLAAAVASVANSAATQAQLDALLTQAQADIAALTPPTTLNPIPNSFLSRSVFNAAVAAYTGPEKVKLDGVEVPRFTSEPDTTSVVPGKPAVAAVPGKPAVAAVPDSTDPVTGRFVAGTPAVDAVPETPAVDAVPDTTVVVPGKQTAVVGTDPAIEFFSHSDKNGDIDNVGPTS